MSADKHPSTFSRQMEAIESNSENSFFRLCFTCVFNLSQTYPTLATRFLFFSRVLLVACFVSFLAFLRFPSVMFAIFLPYLCLYRLGVDRKISLKNLLTFLIGTETKTNATCCNYTYT